MPQNLPFSLTTAEQVTIALALVLMVLLAMIGYRSWQRSRVTPEQRERMRRDVLVAHGKMGDATLMEVREDYLVYSYDVRGIEYTASQDIAPLRELMPSDLSALASVSVKYDARNPANSIVLAEGWSGLRTRKVS
ncbi:MAG TPA: hypothetical protein VMH81_29380 [Bryobacteraceae bacterium]|nr:hypothetical protein [Bryobacteraceae bacterium]